MLLRGCAYLGLGCCHVGGVTKLLLLLLLVLLLLLWLLLLLLLTDVGPMLGAGLPLSWPEVVVVVGVVVVDRCWPYLGAGSPLSWPEVVVVVAHMLLL